MVAVLALVLALVLVLVLVLLPLFPPPPPQPPMVSTRAPESPRACVAHRTRISVGSSVKERESSAGVRGSTGSLPPL